MMHASEQTDHYAGPAHRPLQWAGPGWTGRHDDDEHSRRQSSVQRGVFPESPARVPEQNQRHRRVLPPRVHVWAPAFSLLHNVCPRLSAAGTSGQIWEVKRGRGGGAVPEVPSYSNMKWEGGGAGQHLVHYGIQEGAHTRLECDAVAWNV